MSRPEEAAPPPSYKQATGRDNRGDPPALSRRERNGIPMEERRSMEDEHRPLPAGWVRRFDPEQQHMFFVDTRADPPRSIWHHPFDDETYLNSLEPTERQRIDHERRTWSWNDVEAESTDEEDDDHHDGEGQKKGSSSGNSGGGHHLFGHGKKDSTGSGSGSGSGRSLGRRMKDTLTGSTHEQRVAQRNARAKRERELYEQHRLFRRGLEAAVRTGQPQLLGEDDGGRYVYLQPPGKTYPGVTRVERLSPRIVELYYDRGGGPTIGGRTGGSSTGGRGSPRFVASDDDGWDGVGGGYGGGLGGGGLGYGGYGGGLGYGGYGGGYRQPYGRYGRPMGYGYGGGLGFPMMMPLFGGLALGSMMGGMMF
ncbi:hypothetical protein GGR56DRAFT_678377 [Xylariaceae sp. FL0804]|nr:hypothetical protein GGR56DRAFT_678377 [Xylariaceae sp. FL0804]